MLFSGIFGTSSEFSSILSITELSDTRSPLDIIVKERLQIINKVAIILVLLVLMQKSEGGALGIGVSQESFMFSRTAGDFLTKATAVIATLFIICSLSLTIISRGDLASETSVIDKMEQNSEEVPKIPENNN